MMTGTIGKKVLALILTASMLLSALPLNAMAVTTPQEETPGPLALPAGQAVGSTYTPQDAGRQHINFNRQWKFQRQTVENDTAPDFGGATAAEFDDAAWADVALPHSFSMPYNMETSFFVGYGLYRKHFDISQADLDSGKRVSIEFEGAFIETEVFVNGEAAGSHLGGYTGFQFDITDKLQAGDNLIAVRVNNKWRPDQAPRSGDHQFSGGIYRDVYLNITDSVHVTWYGTAVTTPALNNPGFDEKKEDGTLYHDYTNIDEASYPSWDTVQANVTAKRSDVQVQTELKNDSAAEKTVQLRQEVVDNASQVLVATFQSEPTAIAPGATATVDMQSEMIQNVKLWDAENPNLYTVYTTVFDGAGQPIDSYTSPLGFRWAQFRNDAFYLNGVKTVLFGANVHQDHAGWADAVTNEGFARDVQMVKDAGMNFIRGSHYPHDPAFSEACDEKGILFWSEMCLWGMGDAADPTVSYTSADWNGCTGYPKNAAHQENFEASCMQGLTEMIRVNRNHPSTIIWSMGNEIFFPFLSGTEDMPQRKALVNNMRNLAHQLDPTRKAGMGGVQRAEFDRLSISDVAGYNGDGGSAALPTPGGKLPGNMTEYMPSIAAEYGSHTADRGTAADEFRPYFDHMQDGDDIYNYALKGNRAGISLWCAFHHGSVGGAGLAKMGFIDYSRLPLQAWYWYRQTYTGVPAERAQTGSGTKLALTASQTTLPNDGTADAHLIVTVQNAAGEWVNQSPTVTLEVVSGPGVFPTGKTITLRGGDLLRNGKGAIEFRSYYSGETVIEASAPGLTSARITFTTTATLPEDGSDEPVGFMVMPQVETGNKLLDAGSYGPDKTNHPTYPSSGNGAAGNDGDTSTKWTAATLGAGQYWMQDTEYALHLYKLKLEFDGIPYPYKVEVSMAKEGPWTQVAEYTAATVGTRPYEEDLGGVRGRFIKVTFTDVPSESYAFLNEATFYGVNAAGAADEEAKTGYTTDSAYVSDLAPTKPITQGWAGQTIIMDKSIEHNPITVAGIVYAKGLGLHANSEAVYNLAGKYTRFQSVIGIDSEVPGGDAIFRIYGTVKGTEKLLFEQQMTGGQSASVDISVRGVTTLRLVTDKNGADSQDHTDWADAKLLGVCRNITKGASSVHAAVASNTSGLVAGAPLNLNLNLKNTSSSRRTYQTTLALYNAQGVLVKLAQTEPAFISRDTEISTVISMVMPEKLPLGSEVRLNVYDGETLELLAQTSHFGVKTPVAGQEAVLREGLLSALSQVLDLLESDTVGDYNPLGVNKLRTDFAAAYGLYCAEAPTEAEMTAAAAQLRADLEALAPATDTAPLAAAIVVANAAAENVVAAEGPETEVALGLRFVSAAQMQSFTDAIATANAALSTVASSGEMRAATNALQAATSTFTAAIKTGTKIVPCTVTFQTNGGTSCPQLVGVTAGSTIVLPVTTRENHSFDGWYTNASCTKKFAAEQKITGDLTLYAKWNLDWDNSLTLFYDKPSSATALGGINSNQGLVNPERDQRWQQTTLPIGSGDLGANIYGEIGKEHLTFNEKTLWTGGPSTARPNYRGGNIATSGDKKMYDIYKQIQAEFAKHTPAGDSAASNLCNKLVGVDGNWNGAHTLYGNGYGSYQPWGDIYMDFGSVGEVSNYRRWLDMKSSLAGVYFTKDNTEYQREYLASNPDKVVAMKLSAVGTGKLNFTLSFEDAHNVPGTSGNDSIDPSVVATTTAGVNKITMKGALTDNQLRYNAQMIVKNEGGTVTVSDGDKLTVTGAGEVTIFLAAATDYKQDYPVYRTGETADALHARVAALATAAAQKGYEKVKADHIADYKSLFDRVTLDLGQGQQTKTTDVMLADYKAGSLTPEQKRILEVNLFQYGRYLTISSSRQDSQLPSNLQGVWANQLAHLWGSDYHMNVNLQMNYWPTYSTNLAECADPLIRYVDGLREPGRVTAGDYVGVVSDPAKGEENGFMAHTQNNPFGWTCPGWDFSWGWSPAAVPWILQNCWEQYEFTGDLDYMKQNIYPMLKEEAKLYDKMLIWDATQLRWVLSPTYSPEHGPRTVGNTYEQTLAWQLYDDAITAAGLVGETDKAMVEGWKTKRDGLNPIQIGTDGQIKEWFDETALNSADSGHRHLSHMLGLFPGDLIATKSDWLEAARVSMSNRTDASTGWGMGQRINTWARLGDGNKAYKLVGDLFKNGIYPNMWDAHPPFQIDGNFGYTSGVSEMLAQSNMGFISLLPALPDAWSTGAVKGLITRGNFELSMDWAAGKLTEAKILAKNGGDCLLGYPGISQATVTDSKGQPVTFTASGSDRITLNTTKGETYTINKFVEPMAAPTGLAATRANGQQVSLRWNAVSGATRYAVYRQVDDGAYALMTTTAETSFTDTDAEELLGTYRYQVASADETRCSNPSAAVQPTIPAGQAPTSITLTTQGGLTTLSKENSTLQLSAAIAPATASHSLRWSVNDATLATVSAQGLVTTKSKSGSVIITATSVADGTKTGTITIKIALPTGVTETIVEDGTPDSGTSGTKNPAITWSGAWTVWSGEREDHKYHGDSKTESNNAGDFLEYSFTGTGIDVYVQKAQACGALEVILDGTSKGTFPIYDAGSGVPQFMVASYQDLANGPHKIKLVVRADGGRHQGNLDYFKVYSSAVVVDKAPLQVLVEQYRDRVSYAFTPATWTPFKAALDGAVALLNNAAATSEEVTDAVALLTEKALALAAQDVPAPIIPPSAVVKAKAVQSDRMTLVWPAIEKADHYEVSWQADSRAMTLPVITKDTKLLVEDLAADQSYTFQVTAVTVSNHKAELAPISATTKAAADAPLPKLPHDITRAAMTHGTVEISHQSAIEGTKISLTVLAEDGYRLKTGSLCYNGIPVNGNSFLMPNGPVTITAVFEPIPVEPIVPPAPSGGGESSSNTTTTTEKHADGSVTTKVTNKNTGTITATTQKPDGTIYVVETKKDGSVRSTETRTDGVTIVTTAAPDGAVTAKVHLPEKVKTATVSIPAAMATAGTVPMLVRPDGTEELLRISLVENGMVRVTLTGDATLRLANNYVPFRDVAYSSPYYGAVSFAAARGLLIGTATNCFDPEGQVSRAMVATVLYRLSGGASLSNAHVEAPAFGDVLPGSWYEASVRWAAENGITSGTGKGFCPGNAMTREQVAVFLYHYVGSPKVEQQYSFADSNQISPWAQDALNWAVSADIFLGQGNGRMNPGSVATRVEVAVLLQRLVTYLINGQK